MQLAVKQLIEGLGATVHARGDVADVVSVSIDTRTLQAGDWFVAIAGPHFDGHDYLQIALQKGAAGIVTTRAGDYDAGRPYWHLQVADTVVALGQIAAAARTECVDTSFVGITGSNGKSTTKEMVASIATARGSVLKTEGNFNNLFGMPLTLCGLQGSEATAVIEMGMSAAGEIRQLTEILRPDIGVITNVSAAHLETLQTIENVAAAKGELFATMPSGGTIIVNAEDPWVMQHAAHFSGSRITYGMQNTCDVQFAHSATTNLTNTVLSLSVHGTAYETCLPVPGVHNVMNALAATAVGVALDIPVATIMERLAEFTPMRMRMERVQLENGVQVINDSYNANPDSMRAALRTISAAKRAGNFYAVFGDMLELGDSAHEQHRALGADAVASGAGGVFATGDQADAVAAGAQDAGLAGDQVYTGDVDALSRVLLDRVQSGDVVLVKGSRGMHMERVVEHLKTQCGVV